MIYRTQNGADIACGIKRLSVGAPRSEAYTYSFRVTVTHNGSPVECYPHIINGVARSVRSEKDLCDLIRRVEKLKL